MYNILTNFWAEGQVPFSWENEGSSQDDAFEWEAMPLLLREESKDYFWSGPRVPFENYSGAVTAQI